MGAINCSRTCDLLAGVIAEVHSGEVGQHQHGSARLGGGDLLQLARQFFPGYAGPLREIEQQGLLSLAGDPAKICHLCSKYLTS